MQRPWRSISPDYDQRGRGPGGPVQNRILPVRWPSGSSVHGPRLVPQRFDGLCDRREPDSVRRSGGASCVPKLEWRRDRNRHEIGPNLDGRSEDRNRPVRHRILPGCPVRLRHGHRRRMVCVGQHRLRDRTRDGARFFRIAPGLQRLERRRVGIRHDLGAHSHERTEGRDRELETAFGSASGSGWYAAGSFGLASVNSSIISVSGTERQAFAGWSGDATGSSGALSNPIAMDGPKTAHATWKVEYLVRIDSDIQIQIDGGGWYPAGTHATLRAPQELAYGGQTYRFSGWTGGVNSSATEGFVPVYGPLVMP